MNIASDVYGSRKLLSFGLLTMLTLCLCRAASAEALEVMIWSSESVRAATEPDQELWHSLASEVFDPGDRSDITLVPVADSTTAHQKLKSTSTVAIIYPPSVFFSQSAGEINGPTGFEVLAQSLRPASRPLIVTRAESGISTGPKHCAAVDLWSPESGFFQMTALLQEERTSAPQCQSVGTAEDALNYLLAGLVDFAFVSESEFAAVSRLPGFPVASLRVRSATQAAAQLGSLVAVNRKLVTDLDQRERWQRRILSVSSADELRLVPSSNEFYVSTRMLVNDLEELVHQQVAQDRGAAP